MNRRVDLGIDTMTLSLTNELLLALSPYICSSIRFGSKIVHLYLSSKFQRHRDLLHDLGGKVGTGEGAEVIAAANASELESLRYEKESQGKELLILRRTVDELEIRIETQKQTLAARDASIKTLLDMLQVRD